MTTTETHPDDLSKNSELTPVMRRLSNDVCRCHDYKCRKSTKCFRFLQRDTKFEQSIHAATLLPEQGQNYCDSFIGV